MKTRRLFALAILGASAGTAFSADAPAEPPRLTKTSVPIPLSPRFQQVRDRIDALFRHRNEPPAPLDPRSNPFRPAGAFVEPAPPADGRAPAAPPEPAQSSDLTLLQQAVATLKVSGLVEIAGTQHRIVNSRPYKEGDVIQTLVQGQSVYLRVKNISPKSLTLGLNEAEMTLRF